jgi:hypothetical protein
MASPPPRPLSRILVELAETDRERVSLSELAAALGDRSFAALMILFAAPNLVPLPPGSSTVLAVPLILVAGQLLIGLPRVWLPRWLGKRTVDQTTLASMARKLEPLLQRFERLARPRYWPTPPVIAERFVGGVVLVMAVILIAPIPFANWTPALSVILVSLALTERDGLWLAFGVLIAAGSLLLLASIIGSIGFAATRILD